MKIVLKTVLTLVALISLIVGGWAFITLHYTYSAGERAGYIQKISRKGWICKTWEGELAMANLPGAMPQIFTFTVRDEAVAHEIEQHAGQQVSLSYEQHPGIPSTCFGDTEYFVVKLSPAGPAKAPEAMSVPAPAAPAPTAAPAPATATPAAPAPPPPK